MTPLAILEGGNKKNYCPLEQYQFRVTARLPPGYLTRSRPGKTRLSNLKNSSGAPEVLPAGQIRRHQPTRTCEQPGCPRYGAITKQARTVKASVQGFVACKIFTALDYCAKDVCFTTRDASPRGRFSRYVSAGFWAPWIQSPNAGPISAA